MMAPETVVTVEHGKPNQAQAPPQQQQGALDWIKINLDYFKTPPGLLKIIQLVSKRKINLDRYLIYTFTYIMLKCWTSVVFSYNDVSERCLCLHEFLCNALLCLLAVPMLALSRSRCCILCCVFEVSLVWYLLWVWGRIHRYLNIHLYIDLYLPTYCILSRMAIGSTLYCSSRYLGNRS